MRKRKNASTEQSRNKMIKMDDDYQPTESDDTDYSVSVTLTDTDSDDVEYNEYEFLLKEEFHHRPSREYKQLTKQLSSLCLQLENKKVTLTKILQSHLPESEMLKAVELFGVLRQMDENTIEFIKLNAMLSNMIDQSYLSTIDNNDKILAYQEQLLADTPTLDQIVNANITEQDKMLAIQTYQTFYQVSLTDLYSVEWFQLRKKLINLMSKTLSKEEQELRQHPLVNTTIKQQILTLPASLTVKRKLFQMYETMLTYDDDSHIKDKCRIKLKWLLSLPYQTISTIEQDVHAFCFHVYQQLNLHLYGMEKVKEKLLFCLHNQLRQQHPTNVLALKGLPGVGKTKLIQVFAKAVGRYYEKISFGGAIDATVLSGSDPVWSGSGPSVLLQILARAKIADPIVALDEIDKTSESPKGREVHHALLHILDPTQSTQFNDLYLNEYSHDLSHVWFIATMNDDQHLDPALRDRCDIVDVPAYTKDQQIDIMRKFTLPDMCEKCGLKRDDLTIDKSACDLLLSKLSSAIAKTGLRPVEKAIYDIVSKLHFLSLSNQHDFNLSFKVSDFTQFPYNMTKKTIRQLCDGRARPSDSVSMMYS